MKQVKVLQQVISSPIIAGSARQIDIFEVAAAAASMRQDVIILRPHTLECRMLGRVRALPGHRFGIFFVDRSSHFGPNNRYFAEPAIVAVSLMNPALYLVSGISWFGTLVLR